VVMLWNECGWQASMGVDGCTNTASGGSGTLSASIEACVIKADSAGWTSIFRFHNWWWGV